MEIKVTYDSVSGAAYIYLGDIPPGGVWRTRPLDEDIKLDFDAADRLIGIEVLNAKYRLPGSLWQQTSR